MGTVRSAWGLCQGHVTSTATEIAVRIWNIVPCISIVKTSVVITGPCFVYSQGRVVSSLI